MSPLDLPALEELAKAATPGPWTAEDSSKPPMRSFLIQSGGRVVARYLSFDDHLAFAHRDAEPERVSANAAYIAAANPETVLALIERIRALEAER